MKQFEQQFEAHLAALKSDGRAAATFVYTEITLHHFFGGDMELLDRVNEHAGFWNGVLAALQSSGFIALGRLYDDDRHRHTIQALLQFADKNMGLFRPVALQARRQAAGMKTEDAEAFAQGTWTLKPADLSPVRTEFEKLQELYKANVQPIRHEVFAHAGRIKREELNARFTKVLLRDLERMVVFPLRLERSLSRLYSSGTAPTLEPVPTNMVEILNNLPADTSDMWEHFHAIRSTAKMAAWMKLTPAPPEKIDSSIIEKLARAMELEALGLKEEDFAESAPSNADGAPA